MKNDINIDYIVEGEIQMYGQRESEEMQRNVDHMTMDTWMNV